MGLTCKSCGKYESLFKKLDNQLKGDAEKAKKAKEKDKKKNK